MPTTINPAPPFSSQTAGVFGSVFCDFGDEFIVSDTNGEPASSCIVGSITQANPALVTVLDDSRHNLESGDAVTLDSCQVTVARFGLHVPGATDHQKRHTQ